MGASESKEEEEAGQQKQLEKSKDDPNNKKLEGGANFKVFTIGAKLPCQS